MKVNRISNHNIMKKIACFILLSSYLLVLTSLQAQNLSVKGTVRDAKTGEVLPMVNVGLMRVADTVFVRGAATEFDGTFHIKTRSTRKSRQTGDFTQRWHHAQ